MFVTTRHNGHCTSLFSGGWRRGEKEGSGGQGVDRGRRGERREGRGEKGRGERREGRGEKGRGERRGRVKGGRGRVEVRVSTNR